MPERQIARQLGQPAVAEVDHQQIVELVRPVIPIAKAVSDADRRFRGPDVGRGQQGLPGYLAALTHIETVIARRFVDWTEREPEIRDETVAVDDGELVHV